MEVWPQTPHATNLGGLTQEQAAMILHCARWGLSYELYHPHEWFDLYIQMGLREHTPWCEKEVAEAFTKLHRDTRLGTDHYSMSDLRREVNERQEYRSISGLFQRMVRGFLKVLE